MPELALSAILNSALVLEILVVAPGAEEVRVRPRAVEGAVDDLPGAGGAVGGGPTAQGLAVEQGDPGLPRIGLVLRRDFGAGVGARARAGTSSPEGDPGDERDASIHGERPSTSIRSRAAHDVDPDGGPRPACRILSQSRDQCQNPARRSGRDGRDWSAPGLPGGPEAVEGRRGRSPSRFLSRPGIVNLVGPARLGLFARVIRRCRRPLSLARPTRWGSSGCR